MSKTEKWLLICGSVILWVTLAYFAGGPIFSDEMLYIDVGLRNLVEPHYGNRYFHIYLQKLFMAAAPSPLIGIRVFWGFLMALTAALIYVNARKFTDRSSGFNGLLAVALFFSFSIVREYSGEPAVDITVMAVVSVYVTVYLDLLRRNGNGDYHLFALGLLAFLGLKTKETTIFVHLLLFGLLKGKLQGRGWFKPLLKYFVPFLLGVAGGIVLFIILDGIFLGQPLFAILPSTFRSVFENYDFIPGFFFGPTSWYTEYLFDDILLAFVLFLASGFFSREPSDRGKRWVYVFPLIYIAFLSWNMLKVPWGFIERFVFPVLPVIAILGAQAVYFHIPEKGTKRWRLVAGMFLAALVFFAMRGIWSETARAYSFDYARLLESVYFPILISLLLASLVWSSQADWWMTVLQVFCIATLLFTPLSNNFKYFIRYPQVRERYAQVFYPLETFKEELVFEEGDTIYLSTDIKKGLDMLSLDPNDISGMVNFYFDDRIQSENVYVGYNRKKVASDLTHRPFSYALLTGTDVASLQSGVSWQKILDQYRTVLTDENESIYLLKR